MILRLVNGAIRRVRATYYSFMGVHIEGHCWLQRIEVPQNYRSLRIKEGAAIDRNVTLLVTGASRDRVRISIGNSVYINRHTMIDASESIAIERDCMIGPFCYITDHDHGTDQGISVKDQPLVSAAVTIEKEAWIGAHVTILKGVRIGRGAIVGAGSVVTKSVEPETIVAGVPARTIGNRQATKQ